MPTTFGKDPNCWITKDKPKLPPAFMYHSDQVIRDSQSGMPLEGYVGLVIIYGIGPSTIFETGFEEGERFWKATTIQITP